MSKISALLQNPDKANIVDVYADGEYVMSVTEDTAFDAGLKIGKPLDVDTLEQIERSTMLVKAKAKAYNYLSYGDMSANTLKTKLARAGFDNEISDLCVCAMIDSGYINDERYASSLANYLATVKNYGPRRIEQEMFLKGISGELAQNAIDALEVDFCETIKAHIPKSFDYSDKKSRDKLCAALVRRGFDFDTINYVIKEPDDFE